MLAAIAAIRYFLNQSARMLCTAVVSFRMFPAIIRHSCHSCFPAIHIICVDQASQVLAISHAPCCSISFRRRI